MNRLKFIIKAGVGNVAGKDQQTRQHLDVEFEIALCGSVARYPTNPKHFVWPVMARAKRHLIQGHIWHTPVKWSSDLTG